MSLFEGMKVVRLLGATTATTNSSEIDMFGFRSILYLLTLSTVGADGVVTLAGQVTKTSGSGYATRTDASIVASAAGASNGVMVLDQPNPDGGRYHRAALTIAGTATVASLVAVLYDPREQPTDVSSYKAGKVVTP